MALQGSIHEYLEAMISVNHAFTERSNALHHVQSLSADLFSLHTREGRLQSSTARDMEGEWLRHHKVEGVKETIRSAEAAKSDALREYESIKVICMETVCKIKMLHPEKMKGHELI
jgi:sorting nexin-1/2